MTSADLDTLARRHGFSPAAAAVALAALERTNGALAQFSHPELGGYGQWMPGMVMLGDMGNLALKARVDALFTDLAQLVRARPQGVTYAPEQIARETRAEPEGRRMDPMKPMEPMKPMAPMRPLEPLQPGLAGERPWWPGGLGTPSSAGGQNDVRYAYFPGSRRLAIERGGTVAVYDTANHHITGVSQSQGARSELMFSTSEGNVPLHELKQVEK